MFWLPIIAGATVGALTNKKDPLKGAILGGTLGYAGGSAFGAGGSGGILGSTTANTAGSAASNTIVPGSIESVMGQAGAAGTYTNPDYYANILGNQVYTGNDGLLSQIGTGAGSIFDSTKTSLGEYATPQNLIGVSNLLGGMNQAQPMPSAGGGGLQGGTPPKFEPFRTGQVYGRKKRGEA